VFLAAAILMTGCKSAPKRLAERLERSISWIATLETAGHSWAENRVPASYAERTIEEARAALASAEQPRAARIASELADVLRNRDQTEIDVHLGALALERRALEARLKGLKRGK